MKAKVKATGEIIEVSPTYSLKGINDGTIYYTDGRFGEWIADDLDILPEMDDLYPKSQALKMGVAFLTNVANDDTTLMAAIITAEANNNVASICEILNDVENFARKIRLSLKYGGDE